MNVGFRTSDACQRRVGLNRRADVDMLVDVEDGGAEGRVQCYGRQAKSGVEGIEFGLSRAQRDGPGRAIEKAGESFQEIRVQIEKEAPVYVGRSHHHRRDRWIGTPDPGQNSLDLAGERVPVSCIQQQRVAFSLQDSVSQDDSLHGRDYFPRLRAHDQWRIEACRGVRNP